LHCGFQVRFLFLTEIGLLNAHLHPINQLAIGNVPVQLLDLRESAR
jgi:hypothetical protein